jgi:small nuclear ribonucleoprotein D3
MIIPDMLKNAPMFKRLEARIRVTHHFFVFPFFFSNFILFGFLFVIYIFFNIFQKGKGSALGVGRGRAVAMRARVSFDSPSVCSFLPIE